MHSLPNHLRRILDPDRAPLRLLVAVPDAAARESIAQEAGRLFEGSTVTGVMTLDELLRKDLEAVDALVCAVELPDAGVLEVLEEVLLLRPDLPVVVLADAERRDEAVMAVHQGAYDHVETTDGYAKLLPVVIEKNLAVYRVKQENARLQVQLTSTLAQLKVRNQQLQHLVKELETIAATDALTQIANRRALTGALEQRYAQSMRDGRDLAVLVIDMDGFKGLNDSVGHAAGDRMLQLAARVLKANCRASDVPGRIGGDEFVVVLPETGMEVARSVAERIQRDFGKASDELCGVLGHDQPVTMSIGLATRSLDPGSGADHLLALADRALYSAKQLGKHRLVIHGHEPTHGEDGR